mgnify:CR=1 FL=1
MRLLKPGLLVLLLVLMLFSLGNFFWLSYDTVPPAWDASVHLMSALRVRTVMASFVERYDLSGRVLLRLLWDLAHVTRGVYPPLFQFAGGVTALFSGGSVRSLVMTNTLFMGILLFSLYQIGRKVHSEECGVLSAVVALFYPMVVGPSRAFMLEFSLLAMTALSVYFLLYSERFQNTAYSMLFGISLGLGMLTKPVFLTFIIAPLGYVVCLALLAAWQSEAEGQDKWRVLPRLLIPLAVGVFVAGLGYVANLKSFVSASRRVSARNTIGSGVFSVESMVYYLEALALS